MELPAILTANTYFWNPDSSAQQRRNNEARRLLEVQDFLLSIEFIRNPDADNWIREFNGETVTVDFDYSESCKNVYKSLTVYNGPKKSNITLLKKIAAEY